MQENDYWLATFRRIRKQSALAGYRLGRAAGLWQLKFSQNLLSLSERGPLPAPTA
jgi:hypothetical protein